jgi:hypothetical protein
MKNKYQIISGTTAAAWIGHVGDDCQAGTSFSTLQEEETLARSRLNGNYGWLDGDVNERLFGTVLMSRSDFLWDDKGGDRKDISRISLDM